MDTFQFSSDGPAVMVLIKRRRARPSDTDRAAPKESRGAPINYSDAGLSPGVGGSGDERSSSSASIRAVFGVRPSASRTMRRIASSTRSSASIASPMMLWPKVSRSRLRRRPPLR